MLPLEGLTVVSLEQAVAAPFATRQLADLGARVIKVERPGVGDFARYYDSTVRGMSSHFVWLNRAKESLTLNLKSSEAHAVLLKLLEEADVFVQNLAPGAVERLGLDSDTMRRSYPRLIVCNISGYGQDGPYSKKKAYDLLIQCETGLVSITGTDDTPSKVGISIADIAAGMYAYSGILSALLLRGRTGVGSVLDVSMLEALAEWMGYPAYYTKFGGVAPKRTGASHATIAPYGPFRVAGKKQVFFGIQNDREWARFCESVLQTPELVQDERFQSNSARVLNRDALDSEISKIFSTMNVEEVTSKLDEAQIANAQLNSMEDFLAHPQLMARDGWKTVDSPVGTLPVLLPPVRTSDFDVRLGPIPNVGENTYPILQELGIAYDVIEEWKVKGII